MIISFLTQNGGGGGVDPSVLSAYGKTIAYDTDTHYIQLKNGDTVLSQFNASDFIIDGMVDNVYISGSSLVVDFNTESGKQDIEIPLSDIFDPTNYYNKSQVDAIASGLTDDIDAVELDIAAIEAELDDKLDASAYTPTDLSNYYTKSEVDGIASGKVDTTEYSEDQLTIAQALNDLNNRKLDASAYTPVDLSEYYTSAQTEAAIQEATSGIPTSQVVEQLRTDVNTISGDVVTVSGTANNAYNSIFWDFDAGYNRFIRFQKANGQDQFYLNNFKINGAPVHSTGSAGYDTDFRLATESAFTAHTADTSIHTDASEKASWNAKLDASALNGYYTSAQTDAAIIAATSGKMDDDRLVVLTQAEYDALTVKDPDTLYVISDDNVLDAYMTSAQTEAAISGKADTTALTQVASQVSSKADSSTVAALNNVVTAHTANTTIHITSQERSDWNAKVDAMYVDGVIATKQDTLVSGTNIKTINNESLLGSGNIVIQGGGGISSGEVQSMIDSSISGKMDTSDWQSAETTITNALFELRSELGGLSIVALTLNEYNALQTKDPDTLYLIKSS